MVRIELLSARHFRGSLVVRRPLFPGTAEVFKREQGELHAAEPVCQRQTRDRMHLSDENTTRWRWFTVCIEFVPNWVS